MYPDWPQFYGEFNDEMASYEPGQNALRSDLLAMANDFQPRERTLYRKFLAAEGKTSPRYDLVLSNRPDIQKDNKFYPFRPRTTTSPFSDPSRAFFYRPNLRLGVLYNRLTARQTFEKIKRSPLFRKFPDVIFYSLLDCNWDFVEGQGAAQRTDILGKVLSEAQKLDRFKDLNLRGARFSDSEVSASEKPKFFSNKEGDNVVYYRSSDPFEKGYQQIPYEDLLRLLDLKIEDMDIRFRHDSDFKVKKGYNVYNPKAFYYTDSAMDIGYIDQKYELNPVCDNNGTACKFSYQKSYMEGMRYFNSYFDGSATMNELLSAQMLIYLTDNGIDFSSDPDLDDVRKKLRASISSAEMYFETLKNKYSHFVERTKLDAEFFAKMDEISPWIQLPFTPDLLNIQNRESFWSTTAKTTAIRLRHAQWASREDRKNDKKNLNSGDNLCWNIYASMNARYRK
jgi:hypothetical protein